MPRQGEGHVAHNAVDANANQAAHGAGEATVGLDPSTFLGAHRILLMTDRLHRQPNQVAGTKKAAPMPAPEKGAALEGVSASGGSSQGIKQGSEAGQGAKP